jgi:RNA polymerase sigma factor (sigma-70 family)
LPTELSIEEIIARVLQGEKDLFEVLVAKYYNLAFVRAFNLLFSHEDAEEIAQESFIAAFMGLGTLREPAKFPHWLGGIVRRKAIYFLRKKVRKNEFLEGITVAHATSITEEQSYDGPEQLHVDAERTQIIQDELAALPEKYREVIYMRYFQNCSYQEIGDFLGLTKSGVDTRLQRARAILEQKLKTKGLSL